MSIDYKKTAKEFAPVVIALIALLGLMYGMINQAEGCINDRINRLESRIDKRFDRLEDKLDMFMAKIDENSQRIARLEGKAGQ